jgi:hypothetical protein
MAVEYFRHLNSDGVCGRKYCISSVELTIPRCLTHINISHTSISNNKKEKLYSQFLDQLLEVALGGLLGEDLEHSLADVADLAGLGVAGGLGGLVGLLLGESNSEDAEVVAVGGADINEGLDKRLPLADQGAEFVAGHIHSVEVGDNVVALNILANQSNLAVALSLIAAIQVGERELENTSLQALRGDFCRIKEIEELYLDSGS